MRRLRGLQRTIRRPSEVQTARTFSAGAGGAWRAAFSTVAPLQDTDQVKGLEAAAGLEPELFPLGSPVFATFLNDTAAGFRFESGRRLQSSRETRTKPAFKPCSICFVPLRLALSC
jgi:hypothetical protein